MKKTNFDPEQFEAGENVTDKVQRGGTPSMVVSVRLDPGDSASLITVAEQSGKTLSQIARQAIRAFLAQCTQRPMFSPEITGGGTPTLKVVASSTLGTRNLAGGAAELTRIESTSAPHPVWTGYESQPTTPR